MAGTEYFVQIYEPIDTSRRHKELHLKTFRQKEETDTL